VASLDVVHRPGAYLLRLLRASSSVELGSAQAAPVDALQRHGGSVLTEREHLHAPLVTAHVPLHNLRCTLSSQTGHHPPGRAHALRALDLWFAMGAER
jgi:hypothetical protein